MKLLRFSIFVIVSALLAGGQQDAKAQDAVIRAETLLDGKGHTLHNVLIVVQAGKIVRVEPNAKDAPIAGAASYDLPHYDRDAGMD